MAIITEKELDQRSREMWLKAIGAMELKNYGYTVSLLGDVLKAHPGFLDGRKLLRRAQIGATKGKKSLFGSLGAPSISSLLNKSKIEKDPVASMIEAEKILDKDPGSQAGNRLLMEAAMAAGLPEVAVFALETLHEANRKDTKILHELAQAYMAIDEPDKALEAYNKIIEIKPNDLEAVKGAKDASAASSMRHGGWSEASSYRDVMKDKEEAITLEQQSRVVRSEEGIERLLAELAAQYEADPKNIEVVRKIAGLYEQKDDIENAAQWYAYAASLGGGADSNLERKASDLRVKQLDRQIAALEAQKKADEEAGKGFDSLDALEKLRAQRAEMVLDECRKRVERNPTDMQLRFELGEALFLSGHYREAMPELQKAKQGSNTKIRAANLLAQCMVHNNMLDMAARQFEEAIAALSTMDSTKKDLIYNLGLTYEKMGRTTDYIDQMKKIYEVDMSYRDVEQRVIDSYQS